MKDENLKLSDEYKILPMTMKTLQMTMKELAQLFFLSEPEFLEFIELHEFNS